MVLAWRNSPAVRQHMYTTHQISEQEHKAWFERIITDPEVRWFIHENADNEPDGVVGFTRYDKSRQSACWGFYLGEKRQSGDGLLLGIDGLDAAFSMLNLSKLNAEVLEGNEKSLAFHRRLGFVEEGPLKNYHRENSTSKNLYRFVIFPHTWQARKPELLKQLAERHEI